MDVNENLGLVFSEALTEVIATTTSLYLGALPTEADDGFEEMTGVMNLNGKKNGILFVSGKEADMRVLCSYMIGVPRTAVTQGDIEDALCEFVNMTAGSAKLRLSGTDYMFNLSPPFILKGENMSVTTKSKTHLISRTLGNGEISVKFKAVF